MKSNKIKKIIATVILATGLLMGISSEANATSGYAYSMGGLTTPVSQIISTANNWALCGYTSYYNTDITYSYLSNINVLNSDVLYFSGPGNQNSVLLENNLAITSGSNNGSTEVGLGWYTLTNTKLAIFNACYTASGTSNICTTARNHAADAALGWVGGLTNNDSTSWQSRFQSYLVSGHTLLASVNYADSFSDYNSNYNTKDHVVYGNYSQYISLYANPSSSNETEEMQTLRDDDRVVQITELTCDYDDVSPDVFEDVISAYDKDFDMSDYELSYVSTSTDNSSFVVDNTKKIGDFSTSSGYTFVFNDSKTDVMYDNTIDNDVLVLRDSRMSEKADLIVNDALTTASCDAKDGYTIVDQQTSKYCDLNTGKFYLKVLTECKETNGECYYSYATLVPVD